MRLSELERKWFVTKLGGTQPPSKPLNQLKREYFASQISGVDAKTPFNELESLWQIGVIYANGKTPSNEKSQTTIWKEMVDAVGGIPKRTANENKIEFYNKTI